MIGWTWLLKCKINQWRSGNINILESLQIVKVLCVDYIHAQIHKSSSNKTHSSIFLWLAPKSKNSWLFKELTWFQPVKQLFIVEPRYQQGIHCRFGMRSIIAEAHFDRSRNAISMMRGWPTSAPPERQEGRPEHGRRRTVGHTRRRFRF